MAQVSFSSLSLLPTPAWVFAGQSPTGAPRLLFRNAVAAGAPDPLAPGPDGVLFGGVANRGVPKSPKPDSCSVYEDVCGACQQAGAPLVFIQGPVADRWWSTSIMPVIEPSSGIPLIVCTQFDVTAQREQLNACQAREEVAAAQLGALHRKLLQEQEEQDCLRAATMKLVAATAELRELAGSAKMPMHSDLDMALAEATATLKRQATDLVMPPDDQLAFNMAPPSSCGDGLNGLETPAMNEGSIMSGSRGMGYPHVATPSLASAMGRPEWWLSGRGSSGRSLPSEAPRPSGADSVARGLAGAQPSSGSVTAGSAAGGSTMVPRKDFDRVLQDWTTLKAAYDSVVSGAHATKLDTPSSSNRTGTSQLTYENVQQQLLHQATSASLDSPPVIPPSVTSARASNPSRAHTGLPPPRSSASGASQLSLRSGPSDLLVPSQLLSAPSHSLMTAGSSGAMMTHAAALAASIDVMQLQMSHMSSDSASVAARLEQVQQEAAEQKATHDALLNKANADAAEIKAMYDKVVLDSAAQQQVMNDELNKAQKEAADMKAHHDKALFDATGLQVELDLLAGQAAAQRSTLIKALTELTCMKQDAARSKEQFDTRQAEATDMKVAVAQSAMQAVEQKRAFDAQLAKANADMTEQKAAFDAQLEKAERSAAEMKAAADEAISFKLTLDAQLASANAAAVEIQAALAKSTADAVEQKAMFDKHLVVAQADAAKMKAAFDKSVVDAAEQKAQFDVQLDKANADAYEMKAAFDKSVVDAAEQKAQFDVQLDKANADAYEMKAAFDKSVVDAAEQKAQFDTQLDKANADAWEMKAAFDKSVVDAAEQKWQFDAQLGKATADAVEMKAAYDKSVVDAANQKKSFDRQLGKANANAAEMKAAFDKSEADAVEMKAAFDKSVVDAQEAKAHFDAQLDKANADAAEMKAAYDKSVVDAVVQKEQFDVQLDKATTDASDMKAAFDKSVVDACVAKAQFDAQLGKANADAAEMKAAFDKSVVDAAEQKAVLDARLDKATADTVEMKAAFDKSVVDAYEAKAHFDAHLDKANADAAEMKAAFDKSVVDAAEQKAQFDTQLDKANADAWEMKAAFDKSTVDAAEQRMIYTARLDKATADAAEIKAAYDKTAADAAEQKAGFDSQLAKANADATEMKAAFDKSVADHAESKAHFDARLDKANADAAEMKAAYDKSAVDAAQQQAQLEAQIGKANTDAATMKAAYDKSEADAAKQKAAFDTQLDKANADAVEMKAGFDKLIVDASKLQNDLQAQKSELDKVTAANIELEMQRVQAQLETRFVKDALNAEQEKLHNLQDEHNKVLHQREVLQAELQLALNTYKPKAVIDAGTPADKMLMMLSELLDGTVPSIQDILYVQSAILESLDIYSPIDLGKQLLEATTLEQDVGLALLNQLGTGPNAGKGGEQAGSVTLEEFCADRRTRCSSSEGSDDEDAQARRAQVLGLPRAEVLESFATLRDALTAMFSPSFTFAPDASETGTPKDSAGGANSPGQFSVGAMVGALHKRSGRAAANNSGEFPTATSPIGRAGASRNSADLARTTSMASSAGGRRATRLSMTLEQVPSLGLTPALSRTSSSGAIVAGEEQDTFPSAMGAQLAVDEMVTSLEASNHWQFDAFKLADATGGHPLSALGFYTFQSAGLIERFKLNPIKLARFLRTVEEGYLDNPYHNCIHASDVLQTMHVLLRRGGLVPGYVDPVTHMACLLAAVCHDYQHPGRTNDFLINSSDGLALRYNDKAPLENHHLAATFMMMRMPEYNFLSELTKAEYDKLRKTVIELVLATDMKQHFVIVSHFTTVHRLTAIGNSTPSLVSHDTRAQRKSEGGASSPSTSLQNGAGGAAGGEDVQIVVPLDDAERLLSLQVALKCADLGHTAASLNVHLRWVTCLEEEFFRQGDAERAAGLPISPLFDRSKQGISKSQIGFFDIVVIPLYHAFSRVFTNTKPLLTYVMRNYKVWSQDARPQPTA